ncbi:MAG TPA: hypothetical protein VFQ92_03395 [Blastocatellia bacterium]|nr:hypothetical protein [Blastocatellia bacterium]
MKKKTMLLAAVAAFGLLSLIVPVLGRQEQAQLDNTNELIPLVFQAAGPTIGSIQGSVDGFRAALGVPNNGNVAGPLAAGRREINWDGGGSTATAIAPTPFTGFLVTRGALYTTPGTGFVQAPLSGLAETFGNPSYETIFQAFSPVRLFSPVGSNITELEFFVPGDGNRPATTTGFGAVFTDVDQPDGIPGSKALNRRSTLIECFGVDGKLLFSSFVPASPGSGNLSFFGIKFDDALIARVRVTAGSISPGVDDNSKNGKLDVVMMDDFLYGEPQPIK